jgi:hypothetical protein
MFFCTSIHLSQLCTYDTSVRAQYESLRSAVNYNIDQAELYKTNVNAQLVLLGKNINKAVANANSFYQVLN